MPAAALVARLFPSWWSALSCWGVALSDRMASGGLEGLLLLLGARQRCVRQHPFRRASRCGAGEGLVQPAPTSRLRARAGRIYIPALFRQTRTSAFPSKRRDSPPIIPARALERSPPGTATPITRRRIGEGGSTRRDPCARPPPPSPACARPAVRRRGAVPGP